jgi:hypothetical protein
MKITVPELALVVLIRPSDSGRSTFLKAHFKATEALSSDNCRGPVSDNENDQVTTKDVFEVLHFRGSKTLVAAKLTWHPSDFCLPPSGILLLEVHRLSWHTDPALLVVRPEVRESPGDRITLVS